MYTKKTAAKSVRKNAARANARHKFCIIPLYKNLRVVKDFMLLEPPRQSCKTEQCSPYPNALISSRATSTSLFCTLLTFAATGVFY